MMATSLSYLIIQIPAFFDRGGEWVPAPRIAAWPTDLSMCSEQRGAPRVALRASGLCNHHGGILRLQVRLLGRSEPGGHCGPCTFRSIYQLVDARHDEYVKQQQREVRTAPLSPRFAIPRMGRVSQANRARWKASLRQKLGGMGAFEKVKRARVGTLALTQSRGWGRCSTHLIRIAAARLTAASSPKRSARSV